MADREPEELPAEVLSIHEVIQLVRGQRVMLDEDLARLYGVETKRLNEQVRRNPDRFPEDFMFQLSEAEWGDLKSQFATSSSHGGRRKLPFAFTQEGVAMLSGVLNSERAIRMNVEIMRAFVRFRQYLASHSELASKLKELEIRLDSQIGQQDRQLKLLFEAMRQLREELRKPPPPATKRRIGFHTEEEPAEDKPEARARRKKAT